MDIGMTRENYEKFVQLAVPELPHDIFFQSDETDKHHPACHIVEAKLRDKNSSYNRSEEFRKRYAWHDGLMVDIFVYDRAYLPNNFLIYIQNRCLKHFFSSKKNGNKRKAAVLKWIAKYLPLPFVYDSSLVNNKRKMKKGKFYFNKNELSKLIKVKFKDMETFIPVGYNAFLKGSMVII